MTTIQWISFGILVALIVFAMIYIFKGKDLNYQQTMALRILLALTGAFALTFVTGSIALEVNGSISEALTTKLSAGGGAAMFVIILWFTRTKDKKLEDSITLSTTANASFKENVMTIASAVNRLVNFTGFSPEQLSIKLPSVQYQSKNVKEAIENLKSLSDQLPTYEVKELQKKLFVEINN